MRQYERECVDLLPVIQSPCIVLNTRSSVHTCHEEALCHAVFIDDAIVLHKCVECVCREARELSNEL